MSRRHSAALRAAPLPPGQLAVESVDELVEHPLFDPAGPAGDVGQAVQMTERLAPEHQVEPLGRLGGGQAEDPWATGGSAGGQGGGQGGQGGGNQGGWGQPSGGQPAGGQQGGGWGSAPSYDEPPF